MVACRRIWWILAAITGLAGCTAAVETVAPGALVVVALFVGLNAAGFSIAGSMVNDVPNRRVRTGLQVGVVASAATVALLGLVASLGGLGLLIGLIFAATSPPLINRLGRWLEQRQLDRREAQVPAEEREVSDHPRRPCSEMTTAELVRAWRASFNSLLRAQTTAATNEIVTRRAQYLDELERRDPDGIRRWLDSGARAASDPSRFIHEDDRGEPPSAAA